ncbi:MAG: major capsid protein [Arizlama microvirus]|nr:MAG: major capsid protein [Arizlama microvirus]
MKNPSQMKHVFSEVPHADIPRSVFDRTHTYKTMFNSGYLIPFYKDEVLPGDTFNASATLLLRMPSALNVPVMDNMYLDTFYFFVPNRLVWSNWTKMMGEQATPASSISYTVPSFTAYSPAAESLSDYFGVPPIGAATVAHISLPWRAYNLIWNEWFRDQNLQNSVVVDTDDGPDAIADYVLLKRGKRHDYFTSALPWTQKGTAVTAGLTGNAIVKGIAKATTTWDSPQQAPTARYESDGTNAQALYATDGDAVIMYPANNDHIFAVKRKSGQTYPDIYADLTGASGLSINALRLAFQTQKMLERDARGGTRYTEMVKAHFGVTSPDARLQRPEFLGGKSTPVNVQPVAQTSASDTQPTPLGDLSAFASAASPNEGFTKSFTEHGWIIGLCMVRAELTYQQGLERELSRSTRLDYYFPALSHLGEQAILNKEIYLQGSAQPTQDAAAFGYQERYAEYRYKPSQITGKLRSTYATPLDMWHLAQEFTALPTLGDTFIKETPPISRIIAVTDEPEFVLDAFIKVKAVRPMPVYSVPGLIDHF